jgi:hypothetical protein
MSSSRTSPAVGRCGGHTTPKQGAPNCRSALADERAIGQWIAGEDVDDGRLVRSIAAAPARWMDLRFRRCRVMMQPRSPKAAFASSFSRWPRRAIPARVVTRSAFTMSTAGSSSTTQQLVVPRYKRSSGSMASSTHCSILDRCARIGGPHQNGCCAIRLIATLSHARRRSRTTSLESSRSIKSEGTRAVTTKHPGADPSPLTPTDPRPTTERDHNRRSVSPRRRDIGQSGRVPDRAKRGRRIARRLAAHWQAHAVGASRPLLRAVEAAVDDLPG